MKKALEVANKAIEILLGILLAMMVILVFANVVSRFFLDFSIAWSEELSRFMMVWIVFLGGALAYAGDQHLGLDLVVNLLPKKVAKALACVVDCLVLYCLYLLGTGGYAIMMQTLNWKTPASNISYAVLYVVVPLSSLIMGCIGIFKLYNHVKCLFVKEGVKC